MDLVRPAFPALAFALVVAPALSGCLLTPAAWRPDEIHVHNGLPHEIQVAVLLVDDENRTVFQDAFPVAPETGASRVLDRESGTFTLRVSADGREAPQVVEREFGQQYLSVHVGPDAIEIRVGHGD